MRFPFHLRNQRDHLRSLEQQATDIEATRIHSSTQGVPDTACISYTLDSGSRELGLYGEAPT